MTGVRTEFLTPASCARRTAMIDQTPPSAPLHRPLLAPPDAGAGAEPGQHRRSRCICRFCRATFSIARCIGRDLDDAGPRRRCCSPAVTRRQLCHSTWSADCATRACRPTSCSTCVWRCTGICSGCRRASTRGPGSATSCRASTTTSARFSGSPPETALAWVGNVLFLGRHGRDAGLAGCAAVPRRRGATPLGIWALSHYRGRLEAEVAAVRQRSADIGSFLIETLQAMRAGGHRERAGARGRAIPRRNAAFVAR